MPSVPSEIAPEGQPVVLMETAWSPLTIWVTASLPVCTYRFILWQPATYC